MSSLSPENIQSALARVIDPDSGRDVIDSGMISGLVIKGGKVGFVLTLEPQDVARKAPLREACEAAVKALPGVESVTAVLTAQGAVPIPPKPEAGYTQPRERAQWNLTPVEGVSRVIAVASGKGGVGKSTTTVNLARALMRRGLRAGVLDADIYGPSLPRMLGLGEEGQPPIVDGKMMPPASEGLPCMSMGFITGAEAAILRGPMISKTLHQLLRFTRWGQLDALLVDMPPGTGDIHLSLAQQVPLSGAVIVTTPQDVAADDARKCLKMFGKLNVPILGVVENMSYLETPAGRMALFGTGGGKRLAAESSVPFLGEIPLDPALVQASESGETYDGAYIGAYDAVAAALSAAE
ncbi:MAG: iron-sulfur cluster carrier protein ApbC [Proteobacteria bacterium]|nr:iron-sulfur cluster carrier protein ApbC [Pseudomonadota bacterium]